MIRSSHSSCSVRVGSRFPPIVIFLFGDSPSLRNPGRRLFAPIFLLQLPHGSDHKRRVLFSCKEQIRDLSVGSSRGRSGLEGARTSSVPSLDYEPSPVSPCPACRLGRPALSPSCLLASQDLIRLARVRHMLGYGEKKIVLKEEDSGVRDGRLAFPLVYISTCVKSPPELRGSGISAYVKSGGLMLMSDLHTGM